MRLLAALVALCLLPGTILAQERPNTILVLDASGSMWGQIDGINKIVIARDVIADLLADFPANQNLGLTVYGHRARGECTDIETIVVPGLDNRAAIADAVNAIDPRGMTPMTDAVIAAAEALRFTEQKATVILVSDGIETCNPDPCAAARALEEAGVDFTAHVVGFDVTEAEALRQMQCLADETGGVFLSATNAAELTSALEEVAVARPQPEPEPRLFDTTFMALLGPDGADISDRVIWDVISNGTTIFAENTGAPLVATLEQGAYTATGYFVEGEIEASADFLVVDADQTVTVVFPLPAVKATMIARDSAALGATIPVGWEGPGAEGDFISVGEPGERYINYSWTREGNPVALLMPNRVGEYELRYHSSDETIIGTRMISVTEVNFGVTAPDAAAVGSQIAVEWIGPGYAGDFISVGVPGERYVNYTYTREGNPLQLLLPNQPGNYEIRYSLGQGELTMATRMISVSDVAVSVTGPATASVGERLSVDWSGPGYDDDFIAVGRPGERYTNYTWTREGSPAQLLMPAESGDYEIRYILGQGEKILATQPVTVEDLAVTVQAASEAAAGATIPVTFDGPGYDDDFIGIGRPDERYTNYSWTREGSPAQLLLPTEPGDYEIRYILGQGEVILGTTVISITPITARLIAPLSGVAGTQVPVGFEGPAYDNDFIGIGLPGEDTYATYTYVRDVNPVSLSLPDTAGDYEIRYYLGQGDSILARVPFRVTK